MIRLALGWTLVHSLWQGAAAALVLALALCILRTSRARYLAACLALLAIVLAFPITFSRELHPAAPAPPSIVRANPAAPSGLDHPRPIRSPFDAALLLPWLTPFWIVGVIAFHLHAIASWFAARRMLRRGVCQPPDQWQQRLLHLRERLRIAQPVTLLESCLTNVPVVIGWLQPVVLIPAGLLTGMPAQQIEAILIHELAHVQRRDYLVNLLQTLVESFLFYHPAVWWISRVIRTEREHCCDDVVVAVIGDAPAYAAALAELEQTRWAAHDAALAATGGNLMKRVRRLLHPSEGPRTALSPVLSAAVLTLTATLVLTAWQTNTPPPPKGPFEAWLNEDVAYIINNQERTAFKALETDAERKMFIIQFWDRRNPVPGSDENQFKQEHYRRIAYTNAHFASATVAGWKTDRGRIYIIYGPADEIETHPAGDQERTFPYEQWRYHHIPNVGENVMIEYVDPTFSGEFRMTSDPHP